MWLVKHRSHFEVTPFPVLPMFDSEAVFKITVDPHFADYVAIQRHICCRDELDQESRCCRLSARIKLFQRDGTHPLQRR